VVLLTEHRITLFGMPSSREELLDLLKAWSAVSIAFALLLRPEQSWAVAIGLAALTVGLAFLVHELAHKYMAQKYRCWAEFRSFDYMLVLAVLTALAGFIFAAPGAVMIRGHVTRDRYGKIALAGPAANIVIALLLVIPVLIWTPLAFVFFVNSWLAVFNLLPFPSFDGAKVYSWNKGIYFTALVLSAGLLILSFTIFSF
jgi:Zn-dependent protease